IRASGGFSSLSSARNPRQVLRLSLRTVKQDYVKAMEWYKKAAAKDEALAMTDLGDLYREGSDVGGPRVFTFVFSALLSPLPHEFSASPDVAIDIRPASAALISRRPVCFSLLRIDGCPGP